VIRTLGYARLKTGERLRLAALSAPARRYAAAIRDFLAHKGQPWLMHVDLANEGKVDKLRTTYYVGFLGAEIVGNVMIVGDGRAGILGHVYTRPDHRRKGVCQRLMLAALTGFCKGGGQALSLGTGYNSPAYWIYHGFGFRSVEEGSGSMVLECVPGSLARYFGPAGVRVTAARWEHWAGLSLLFAQPEGNLLRSKAYGIFGPAIFEGGFLQLQAQRERLGVQAQVLVTRAGHVVGAAILQRDPGWPAEVHTLDIFVHPSFQGKLTDLLGALEFPARGKVQAYLDYPSSERVAALMGQGFRLEATLPRQLVRKGQCTDVLVYSRWGEQRG